MRLCCISLEQKQKTTIDFYLFLFNFILVRLPNTMSKFKPMELIDKMSGKFHSKSKYYAAEKYGTQYTGLVGEITVPPTEKQVTNREKFTTARANVAALSEEQIAAYREAFRKSPGKYKSLQGYIFAMERKKLV